MAEFKNEFTFRKFSEEGRESDFNSLFERAVDEAERDWLGREYPLYVGDRKITLDSKLTERSPIDGRVICTCQKAGREETRLAVESALQAFDKWQGLGYIKRSRLMMKAADLFSKNKFLLSAVLSIENGKNRLESMGEVDEATDFLRYYSLQMLKNKGYSESVYLHGSRVKVKLGFHGSPGRGERVSHLMKPYGVFGVIAPFNFPVSISTGMSSGAMITGNTVVFKPSSTGNMSMLSGVLLYHLFTDAGIPPGVFNYVSGPGAVVGDELATNSTVSGIVFTGSMEVGMGMISKSYSLGQNKEFIVEMGGKNSTIVSDSADLEGAAAGVVAAAFGFGGQKCSALSRVYVQNDVSERFMELLIQNAREIKVGNPLERDVYMGPLISREAYERFEWALNLAGRDGKVIFGGRALKTGLDGYYVEPTIVKLSHGHELYRKELFLPFLLVDSYESFEDALRMANDSQYGLTAGLYSRKKSEIAIFKNKISAGVVYINRYSSATTGAIVGFHPFVGWKGSGTSGKGTGGRYYLLQFLREQSISESAA